MIFPWANTLLLLLILAGLVSGFFGLVSGSPDRAIFMEVHRVAGYGIVLVLLWKGRNITSALRWRRAATPRTASLVLLLALVATLVLGFVWSFFGPFSFGLFSGVSWHIYVGAALVPILIWHTIYQTRGFPVAFWVERRSFLRLAGLSLAGFALWQAGDLVSRIAALPGASRRFTGSFASQSPMPGAFPVVSWLNDRPDRVDADSWRMTVRGTDEGEVALSYQDLVPDAELTATIDCTGGWYSTQVWRGVPVARLLDLVGPAPEARSVTFTSVTGYYRKFSMAEARGLLLATHVGGQELTHGHGFPARLVAPGKRGFEWVKWVTSIELDTRSKWLQPPLPLQ